MLLYNLKTGDGKMKSCTMTIGSQTHSQKAKKALAKAKISSHIIKIESEEGCSFALSLDCREFMRAAAVIRNIGIEFQATESI